MFCNKCGFKLNDDSVFCSNCGAKVRKESTGEHFAFPKNEQENSTGEIPKAPIKRKLLIPIISATVVVIIVLAIVILALSFSNNSKDFPLYGIEESSISDIIAKYGDPDSCEEDWGGWMVATYDSIDASGVTGSFVVYYSPSTNNVRRARFILWKEDFATTADYEKACRQQTELLSQYCKDLIREEDGGNIVWKNPYTKQGFSVITSMNATGFHFN